MSHMVRGSRSERLRCARRFVRHERGTSVVEMAIISPLLAYLMLATFDFARAFYFAMAVTSAAHTAAHWGSLSEFNATNYGQMQSVATNHAPGLGVTATATRICRCGSGTVAPTTQLCNATCDSTKRVYASVTTTRSFTTIVPYPGIPTTLSISRTAQIRAR